MINGVQNNPRLSFTYLTKSLQSREGISRNFYAVDTLAFVGDWNAKRIVGSTGFVILIAHKEVFGYGDGIFVNWSDQLLYETKQYRVFLVDVVFCWVEPNA